MPLTPMQPTVPPLQSTVVKNNVANPRRSLSRAIVLVQQPTHPISCQFKDNDVEQNFQTYFQRESQTGLVGYLILVLCGFAALCYVTSNAASLEITEAYAACFLTKSTKKLVLRETFSHALWLSDGAFTAVATTSYILAAICIFYIWRQCKHRFPRKRLDPVQFVLLIFFHCVVFPLILVIVAGIEKQTRLTKQLVITANDDKRHSVLLGEGYLDNLLFLELLGACLCTCLLRIQFAYYLVVVAELSLIAIVATSYHGTTSVVPNRRLSALAIFLVFMGFLLRTVREQERSARQEFLTSFHLITEPRRLSNADLEMKEELSGKLNYHLHYEMGDILRILCQIKNKMSVPEKFDIDKIITALVCKHDLFEVTLSSTMPEFEEEIQGWLHMMDFKDHPASSGEEFGLAAHSENHDHRVRSYSLSNDVMRVSTSRSLSSQKILDRNCIASEDGSKRIRHSFDYLEEACGLVNRPSKEDVSSWLMDRLQNHFFVDMFYLEQHCPAPLQAVMLACMKVNGLIERLQLNEKKVLSFAAAVEDRYYGRNPYHNRMHGAAVVADINFYLRRVHLNVNDSTLLVGLVAAAAHDIAHPGVSNGFLIATKSNLAITYSDDSVLERMHIAELYRILSKQEFDVFSTMEIAERTECRKIIIGMILATDLARHFQRISVLKTKTFAMSEEAQGFELALLMETMLMLADLGHTTKPFAYHETWAQRISEEFFRQGEAEKSNDLPISPLCDRTQANLPRSQVTFLTLVATPLFETAGQIFSIDDYDSVISELRKNIKTWEGRIERAEGAVLETQSVESHKE